MKSFATSFFLSLFIGAALASNTTTTVDCPCFTEAELVANGDVMMCGENWPGHVPGSLAAAIHNAGTMACSGLYCVEGDINLSCFHFFAAGLDYAYDITPEEDQKCRDIILANCANPNRRNLRSTESNNGRKKSFMEEWKSNVDEHSSNSLSSEMGEYSHSIYFM